MKNRWKRVYFFWEISILRIIPYNHYDIFSFENKGKKRKYLGLILVSIGRIRRSSTAIREMFVTSEINTSILKRKNYNCSKQIRFKRKSWIFSSFCFCCIIRLQHIEALSDLSFGTECNCLSHLVRKRMF